MKYVGLDLHKRYSYITELDAEGKAVLQATLENTPETGESNGPIGSGKGSGEDDLPNVEDSVCSKTGLGKR